LPTLYKIPLTEECKILPSPGIYAVSVEAGPFASKAMAIIYRRYDLTSEVLLNIFEGFDIASNIKITISFHKKVYGAVDFSEGRTISKINLAREEISELIY
jgi:hypothetical protein